MISTSLGATLVDLGLLGTATPDTPARVLVCGDADYSYASALASRLGGAAEVTATAYEEEDALLLRYPHAAGSIATLHAAGAAVRYGVDARHLANHFGEAARWERIVFNLPQAPAESKARNQIQRHRALLRDFCASASAALAPHGQLWISLLAGQGGTPLDPIQRQPGDTWQVSIPTQNQGLIPCLLCSALSALLCAVLCAPLLPRLKDQRSSPYEYSSRSRRRAPDSSCARLGRQTWRRLRRLVTRRLAGVEIRGITTSH